MNTETNSSAAVPSPEILWQLNGYMYQVGVLRAALELQVWAKVAAGEDSAERLSAAEHWNPHGTRMLLDDLCSLRLLTKQGDHYRLVPEADCYLLPDKPTYMGRFLLETFHWEGHGRLAEAIRTGKRPIGYSATATESIDIWIGDYSENSASPERYLEQCDTMWCELDIQARDGLRVLDLACGPAPRSLALARANPRVRITLLDWERILQVAYRVATNLGVVDQVTSTSGDLVSIAYGRNQYDVAYLGDVTHFFSPEQNIHVFRKAYDALIDGGILVVNAYRREYPDPANPALRFYAISAGGALYDFQEYKDMLQQAGYADIVDVSTRPIKATKRA